MTSGAPSQPERGWTVDRQPLQVLDIDPDLGARIRREQLAQARTASRAHAIELRTRAWDAGTSAELARDGFGLLVCRGMLVRRVGHDERHGAEVLGSGDLLRPWEHDGASMAPLFETSWTVPEPTRLVVLDYEWARRMSRWPSVATELCGRALQRSRRLAVMMAITRYRHVATRLLLLLWEVADQRGRVRGDGVWVELPLTHETLGQIIGARRPSVTTALRELRDSGRIDTHHAGYLLLGERPKPGPTS